MSAVIEREAVDLDELVYRQPRCQANHLVLKKYSDEIEPTTACDVLATWVCARTCDGTSQLWCESRHREHLEDLETRFIVCITCGRHVRDCFRPMPL